MSTTTEVKENTFSAHTKSGSKIDLKVMIKPLAVLTALIIVGVGVMSFMNSSSETTAQAAMTDYYAAHKALGELIEKNRWDFQKLDIETQIGSVIPLYKKIWETYPKSKAAVLARGELAAFYFNHGDVAGAVKLYEAGIAAAASGSLDAMGLEFALASALESIGKCSEAKPHYEKSFNSTQNAFMKLAQEGLVRCAK